MKKFLSAIALLASLSACSTAFTVINTWRGQNAAPAASANQGAPTTLTRAMVNESNAAIVALYQSQTQKYPTYLYALADNAGVATFGKQKQSFIGLRGGLLVSQYFMGNDLLGVRQNGNDPIQYPRPLNQWPSQIARIYQLPGEGLQGDERRVSCQYQTAPSAPITIVEETHQVSQIIEKCQGDDLKFANIYFADASGAIWRSVQWAGLNESPLLLDIVEPLD